MLPPLFCGDLRVQVDPMVKASAASLAGGAICRLVGLVARGLKGLLTSLCDGVVLICRLLHFWEGDLSAFEFCLAQFHHKWPSVHGASLLEGSLVVSHHGRDCNLLPHWRLSLLVLTRSGGTCGVMSGSHPMCLRLGSVTILVHSRITVFTFQNAKWGPLHTLTNQQTRHI